MRVFILPLNSIDYDEDYFWPHAMGDMLCSWLCPIWKFDASDRCNFKLRGTIKKCREKLIPASAKLSYLDANYHD